MCGWVQYFMAGLLNERWICGGQHIWDNGGEVAVWQCGFVERTERLNGFVDVGTLG
jgi:hypothetical protein